MDSQLTFHLLLFLVAFLYAGVGHGGASGYLALMALYGIAPEQMRPTALLLNLFVSLTAFLQFRRSGHFRREIFLPLAAASIPAAFLGGMIDIDGYIYKRILGMLLLIPILRLLLRADTWKEDAPKPAWPPLLLIGAGIGLLSGLIGIGGGILLSPLLLMLGWTNQKQTAAISALFIFVNSMAGLIGQSTRVPIIGSETITQVITAFTGGLLGAYLGARHMSHASIRILLALVLATAAFKLLFTSA